MKAISLLALLMVGCEKPAQDDREALLRELRERNDATMQAQAELAAQSAEYWRQVAESRATAPEPVEEPPRVDFSHVNDAARAVYDSYRPKEDPNAEIREKLDEIRRAQIREEMRR